MEFWLDDIQTARNKKYGYNKTVIIMKALDVNPKISVLMIKNGRMSYYTPGGKARLKMEYGYQVVVKSTIEDDGDIFFHRYSNKAAATKEYKFQVGRWTQMTDGSLNEVKNV